MLKLAILGSTRGTSMQGIIDAIAAKKLSAKIAIVISNKSDAIILQRAQSANIPTKFIDPKNHTRESYDALITQELKANEVDLILLIGYMRILSSSFIHDWQNKILNVHPSLLPAHAGKMDLDVHREVLLAKEKETGCTVHIVTEEVDSGPIVIQKRCPVLASDTPESLKSRVQALESEALIEAIKAQHPETPI